MKKTGLILIIIGVLLIGFAFIIIRPGKTESSFLFDGKNAYAHVLEQENLGPRTPGSPAHAQVIDLISAQLAEYGWQVELQETTYASQLIRNIIARRSNSTQVDIILGAHYDSRFFADRDSNPNLRSSPVPGANDGASGVAVLLELARVLPEDLDQEVWLVFFDAEDQGRIDGWDWILGSRAFVESLTSEPNAVVIVDMIGDKNQDIYLEKNSHPELSAEIWEVAANLGFSDRFINQEKHSILDDHTPFLERGIRAVDIIDFDYPYWHTTQDTSDKVSPESLEVVGRTLQTWLTQQK